tara:strand:+ start:1000 stop:1479 length:480 start_codon:yes stop_codon:yes gene_type:complete
MTDPMRSKLARKSKKRGQIEEVCQFIKLRYYMLNHPAWFSLRPSAIKVYLDLHSYFNGHNNGQIHYSLNHGAKRLSLSKHTVKAALAQLVDHGFIVCTKRGFFTGRQASVWRLTTETAVGVPATNDWKRFQAPKKRKRIPDIGFESILRDIKNDPISLK